MKRLIAIILAVLCMCPAAFAVVDSVTFSIITEDSLNSSGLLATRFQIWPMATANYVAFFAQDNSANILISHDGLATVSDYLDQGAYFGENHDHGFVRNDSLWRFGRNTSFADSNRLVMYNLATTSTISDRNIGMGINSNYTSSVMGGVMFGSIMVVTARGGDWDFRYTLTSDNFATQTNGYIQDYTATALSTPTVHGTRMGVQLAFTDSTVLFGAFLGWRYTGNGTADTVDLWWFDPSDSTWNRETNPPIVGSSLSRFFSFNTAYDSLIVVATFGSNVLNTDSLLIAAWRTVSQTTWTVDTLYDAGAASPSATTALTVIDSTGRPCLWAEVSGNLLFFTMGDDFTWSAPDTVIGADTTLTNGELFVAKNTLANHGSKAYVGVRSTTPIAYLIRANVYESSAEGAKIRSLGGSGFGGAQW